MDYSKYYNGNPITPRQVGLLAAVFFVEATLVVTGGIYTLKHFHENHHPSPPAKASQVISSKHAPLKTNP